jgi:16S rRNA (adenine1518-N6/adenine1519-N6)-dimethyltransferase
MHRKVSYRQKRLGQVFLRDPLTIDKIIQCARLTPGDTVVEIGPGQGALTGLLAHTAHTLYAIEIDARYAQQLQQRFAESPHVHIVHADARTYNYSLLPQPLLVIANLPYSVGIAILTRLFTYRHGISRLVVMLQKEVALRVLAAPGTPAYGALSVFFQYYAAITQCMQVCRTAFAPVPAVDSTVLLLTPFRTLPVPCRDADLLFRVVHWAFMHRRKTLRANLLAVAQLSLDRERLAEMFSRLQLPHNIRAQELSVAHFVRLTDSLQELVPSLAGLTTDGAACQDDPSGCASQSSRPDPTTSK